MPSGVPSDTVVAAQDVLDGEAGDAVTDLPPAARATAPARRRRPWTRFQWGLLAIAVLALGVRAGYVLATHDDVSLCPPRLVCGDAHYYVRQAAVIAAGEGFTDPSRPGPAADHPPLTALVVAPAHRLSGDPVIAITLARLLMAGLGTVVVVGIGLLGRRVGAGRPGGPTRGSGRGEVVGLVAAGIAAVNANLWMNDVVVMSETLAALGIVGTLLAVYRFLDRPALARAVAVGALIGACGLVRAELLLLGPVTFVPMVLRTRSLGIGARLGRVAAAAGVALAVLAPWAAYNLSRFEEPVLLSTNDGLTIAGANCDQMYGLTEDGGTGFWKAGCAAVHEDRIPAEADQSVRSRIYREIGIGYTLDHLDRLRTVVEHRLLRGWGLFAPDQTVYLNVREGRAPWASWTGLVQWWLLLVPAVVGARVLHRRREPVWPLVSTAVIVTLILAAFYGLVRFRLAADVAAVVLAAVALDVLARRIGARRAAGTGLLRRAATGAVPGAAGRNGHAAPTATATAATADGDEPRSPVPAPEPVPSVVGRRGDAVFPCLDAFRGIGMTLVLLNHAAYTTGFQNRDDGIAGILTPIIGRFDMSVPMFFVLSGFLLFRPYARSILGDRPLPSARTFYRRRALRIMPSYWFAILGIGLLLGLRIPGVASWIGNALLAPAFGVPLQACQPNGTCAVAYGLTPAWSIGVEAAYYLLLPVFAYGLYRLARSRPVEGRHRVLLAGLAVLYVGGTAFRAYVVTANPPWAEQSLLWLPMFFDVFAVGMALGVISAAAADGRPLPRLAAWAGEHPALSWGVAGAIFVFMTLLPYPERPFGLRDASGFSDYLLRQFLYGIASAAWLAPAMFGDQRRGRLRAVLSSRPLVYLGAVSLSFYLWHLPIIEKVKELTVPDWHRRQTLAADPPPDNPLASALTFTGSYPRVVLISFVVSLLVASLLYRFVELPFLRLKDAPLRTLLRRSPTAPEAPERHTL